VFSIQSREKLRQYVSMYY